MFKMFKMVKKVKTWSKWSNALVLGGAHGLLPRVVDPRPRPACPTRTKFDQLVIEAAWTTPAARSFSIQIIIDLFVLIFQEFGITVFNIHENDNKNTTATATATATTTATATAATAAAATK